MKVYFHELYIGLRFVIIEFKHSANIIIASAQNLMRTQLKYKSAIR
jgi:hypothetical protein